MTEIERRGPVAPSHAPHCRVCGWTPKPQGWESASALERVVEHIESRHPLEYFDLIGEFRTVLRQIQGDDSVCTFHGMLKEG